MIERVYRIGSKIPSKPLVVVATDDSRILKHVQSFGGCAVMTRKNHPSGTDRVAEVAKKFKSKVIINVQGDEPLLDPQVVQKLVKTMVQNSAIQMATLAHPMDSIPDWRDPNVVKVIIDKQGDAIHFSRATLPHPRDGNAKAAMKLALRHVGIYAFRREFLMQYVRWPQSSLEKIEKLEQLRALEHGIKIRVLTTNYQALGVDVPGDVRKVEKMLKKK